MPCPLHPYKSHPAGAHRATHASPLPTPTPQAASVRLALRLGALRAPHARETMPFIWWGRNMFRPYMVFRPFSCISRAFFGDGYVVGAQHRCTHTIDFAASDRETRPPRTPPFRSLSGAEGCGRHQNMPAWLRLRSASGCFPPAAVPELVEGRSASLPLGALRAPHARDLRNSSPFQGEAGWGYFYAGARHAVPLRNGCLCGPCWPSIGGRGETYFAPTWFFVHFLVSVGHFSGTGMW